MRTVELLIGIRRTIEEEAGDQKGKWKLVASTENHYYSCNLSGHFRKDCNNPPSCYCCKKSHHRAPAYPEKKGLRLCGFGIPGQGYHSMHIPTDREKKKNEVLGIMTIEYGFITANGIERHLRHLFRKSRNSPLRSRALKINT